jgi:flavin-binding protein dodecin
VLYHEESSEALQEAVERFETIDDVDWWEACREQASRFSQARFRVAISDLISKRAVN